MNDIDDIARGILTNRGQHLAIVRRLATRLVQLLDERKPVEPRVWRRRSVNVLHWWWDDHKSRWKLCELGLANGEIFVPGNQPQPTSPPRPAEELEECSEVDW
jgi:hypothetical protein